MKHETRDEVMWEQRRYEIAKKLLQDTFSYANSRYGYSSLADRQTAAVSMAVELADKLVKKLKGENEP